MERFVGNIPFYVEYDNGDGGDDDDDDGSQTPLQPPLPAKQRLQL